MICWLVAGDAIVQQPRGAFDHGDAKAVHGLEALFVVDFNDERCNGRLPRECDSGLLFECLRQIGCSAEGVHCLREAKWGDEK
ncbi:hypothetical protein [Granulicella sp. S190]|uniref:hypothetical protein n=1 Tax=Granulicella sp. S190 TaxID=1747226 RepID=UPI00131E0BF2|nr:hypothetical protein [Granulicella sp. S190]